ncbi:MAG TPA: ATP-binding protein [Pelomicrobium sp.]|nr:ATP-binding protein [Pelomicrobium sp.]
MNRTLASRETHPRRIYCSDGALDGVSVSGGGSTRIARDDFADALLDVVAALICVTNREGRIEVFNHACEEATGYTEAEVRGRAFWDLFIAPEELAAVKAGFDALRAGRAPSWQLNRWRHRSGRMRLIQWSNTVLAGADGEVRHVIGTGIDVTERQRVEDEARAQQLHLSRLQRLYTAGELAGSLAHELNQPLAAIVAYCDAALLRLRRDPDSVEGLQQSLQNIASQAQRASDVIRSLRSLTRREAPKLTPCRPLDLVKGGADLVEAEAQRAGVEVRLHVPDSLPKVLADPLQVEHVVVNLLLNALAASRESRRDGGLIEIAAEGTADDCVRLSIRDNGPGLDPAVAERMFRSFYTTRREGLGLGLAVSRAIIETHGGRIWADPPGPGGAAFHFTLAVAR